MKFIPLSLPGAYRIESEPHLDERGSFARTFCARSFAQHGLATQFIQCSTSFNHTRGQIRGMHYQSAPHEETKLVRCTQGAIFDVMLDIRPGSPTYGRWHGEVLTASNLTALYIPKGFAHGYQTLEDASEVYYMIDAEYAPDAKQELDLHGYGIEWKRFDEDSA